MNYIANVRAEKQLPICSENNDYIIFVYKDNTHNIIQNFADEPGRLPKGLRSSQLKAIIEWYGGECGGSHQIYTHTAYICAFRSHGQYEREVRIHDYQPNKNHKTMKYNCYTSMSEAHTAELQKMKKNGIFLTFDERTRAMRGTYARIHCMIAGMKAIPINTRGLDKSSKRALSYYETDDSYTIYGSILSENWNGGRRWYIFRHGSHLYAKSLTEWLRPNELSILPAGCGKAFNYMIIHPLDELDAVFISRRVDYLQPGI